MVRRLQVSPQARPSLATPLMICQASRLSLVGLEWSHVGARFAAAGGPLGLLAAINATHPCLRLLYHHAGILMGTGTIRELSERGKVPRSELTQYTSLIMEKFTLQELGQNIIVPLWMLTVLLFPTTKARLFATTYWGPNHYCSACLASSIK